MTIRYANEIIVTDLARRITNEMAELNALLTNGALADAGQKAGSMRHNLLGLMNRLDDLKAERA